MIIYPAQSFARHAVPIDTKDGDTVYITANDIKSLRLGLGISDYGVVNLRQDSHLAREFGGVSFETKQKSDISVLYYGYDMTQPAPDSDLFLKKCMDENPNFDVLAFLDTPQTPKP